MVGFFTRHAIGDTKASGGEIASGPVLQRAVPPRAPPGEVEAAVGVLKTSRWRLNLSRS